MGRKRIALIQYASPAVVPADLRVVAAIDYSGGTPPGNLKQVSSYWYNPGDAIPGRFEKVGAVTYASPDVVPAELKAVAAMEPDLVLDAVEYPERIGANPGFETAGAGGVDVWANWTETAADGAIADEGTLVHSGSHAAKITSGVTVNTAAARLSRDITVLAERTYRFVYWGAGDGVNAGRHAVYDVINQLYLVAQVSNGQIANVYAQITVIVPTPAGCTSIRPVLFAGGVNGAVAYFDDVSLKGPTE